MTGYVCFPSNVVGSVIGLYPNFAGQLILVRTVTTTVTVDFATPTRRKRRTFFSLAGISSHVDLQLKTRTNGHDRERPWYVPQRLTHSWQRLRKLHLLYVRYLRTRATDEHVTLIFYLKMPATGSSETFVICKTIGVPPQKI